MIYDCNIFCSTMDEDQAEILGVEDKGIWLPYAFILDSVMAIKMSTHDEESLAFGRTTIFTHDGNTFIIDTPYDKFARVWKEYYATVSDLEI